MTANDLVIYHTPVMVREVIHYLQVRPGGVDGRHRQAEPRKRAPAPDGRAH